ncbi:small integral membrane protein 15 isoform X1 [Mustelus asterias]
MAVEVMVTLVVIFQSSLLWNHRTGLEIGKCNTAVQEVRFGGGGGNQSKGEQTEGEPESRAIKTRGKSRHGVVANQRWSGELKCICFNARSVTGLGVSKNVGHQRLGRVHC